MKKRVLATLLAIALAVAMLPTIALADAEDIGAAEDELLWEESWEDEDWEADETWEDDEAWDEDELDLKDSSEFTPDDHYRWGRDNDYLTAGCAVKNPTAMIEKYTGADVTVTPIDYNYSYDKVNKKVMELLNDGNYVILFRPKGNGYNNHYVYVYREKSLEAGKGNLTQLGTDNGTPKPYKNMWYNTTKYNYPLKPGTTYYYQPFAEVDGTRYYGEIRSFTTPK